MHRLSLPLIAATLLAFSACGDNQSAFGPPPKQAPDLVATGMTRSPDPVNTGETESFIIQIKNRGGADASKFSVRVSFYYYYPPNPIPPCPLATLMGSKVVAVPSGLLAQNSETITFDFNLPDETAVPPGCPPFDPDFSGNWSIIVEMDKDDEVTEDNNTSPANAESNNIREFFWTVSLSGNA